MMAKELANCSVKGGKLQLPACIAGLGLDCYTTATTTPLQGELKQRPEEFIVTELTSDGQFATLDGTASPHQTNTTAPQGGEGPHSDHWIDTQDHNIQPQDNDPLANPNKCTTDKLESPSVCEGPLGDHQRPQETTSPHLDKLVTSDVYQQLVSMAALYSATPSTEPPSPVNLGVVEDKSERTRLHRAVRLAFPHLSTATQTNSDTGSHEIHVSVDTNYPRLRDLLGHHEACRLLRFLNVDRESGCGLLLTPDPCKKHRTEVHRTLGELYGHMVVTHAHSSSVTPSAKRTRTDSGGGGQGQQISVQFRSRMRHKQTKRGGTEKAEVFTKFVLHKENLETLEAVSMLARAMDCHTSQLAYAGSKDTRAITTQCMTVRGVTPSQLAALGPLPHISIGNFQSVHRHIRLGEHGGNHFNIRIRNFGPRGAVDPQVPLEKIVNECVLSLEEKGFVNYFGPQRFGYPREVMSPHIGLAMLQGDHTKAVDLLLSPHGDSDPVQEAKRYFTATQDAVGCLQRMPDHMTRERLVLKALNCHGYSDYGCTRALCNIPYNSRLLYVHSFSSLLWNHLASFRVREYGMQPVVGDLVLRPNQTDSSTLRDAVYMLTSADIESGQYSLRDVVLPTVGTATVLPGNRTADKLSSVLSEVGLSLKSFRLRKLAMSSSGAYRKLIRNIHWRIVRSDGGEGVRGNMGKDVKRDDGEDVGRDLELEMGLPPSCYATVMLRELMKTDL